MTNSLEEDLEKFLEDHFANMQSEPPTVAEAGVGRDAERPSHDYGVNPGM